MSFLLVFPLEYLLFRCYNFLGRQAAQKSGLNDIEYFFEREEQEVYDCLVKPYVMPSTDIGAYAKGEGHPQIAGTFPKYLKEMVRERKLL